MASIDYQEEDADKSFDESDENYDDKDENDEEEVEDEEEEIKEYGGAEDFLLDQDYDFEESRKILELLKQERIDIQDKLKTRQKELKELKKKMQEKQREIDVYHKEFKGFKQKREELKGKLSEDNEKIETEQDKWFFKRDKNVIQHLQSSCKDNAEEIKKLSTKMADVKLKMGDLRKEKRKLEKQMSLPAKVIERLKVKENIKLSQEEIKEKEIRDREKQEYSLMSTPFHDLPGDSKSVDLMVKNYYSQKLSSLDVLPEECSHINILLVGPSGAGKSSFVNTIATALENDGRIVHVVTPRKLMAESATMKLTPETINIGKENKLSVKIFDCRGLATAEKQQIGKEEMEMIIDGHIKHYSEIKTALSMQGDDSIYIKDPTIKEEMHCIVYAVKATRDGDLLTNEIKKEFKELLAVLTPTSKPQFVLLTNMDKVVPHKDIKNLFSYPCVQRRCNKASEITQVIPGYILPTANYTTEYEPTDVKDALCLFNLYRIVSNAHDYIKRKIIEMKVKDEYEKK